jgi:DNA polymerase III alpha subunit (gram-positive type)
MDLMLRGGIGQAVTETLRRHGSLDGLAETNQITLFD